MNGITGIMDSDFGRAIGAQIMGQFILWVLGGVLVGAIAGATGFYVFPWLWHHL
jgi:hypothetical protein